MPASVFNQVTVQAPAGSVAPATQIVEGSGAATGLDVLVFNTSTAVTVYLSEVNSSLSSDAGTPRVSPLGPQQSIVFNGTLDVFALVAPGNTAVLNLYPSATNFTPFVNVTSLFQGGSSGGAPFTTIGPGIAITPLNLVDITLYSSYDLSMALIDASENTAGHALCCRVILSWYDDLVSGLPVFQEIWEPWVVTGLSGAGLPRGIIGSGPMHGKYFSLSIVNPGTGNVTVQYLNVFGSPRQLPVSDWRQYLNGQVQDATLLMIASNVSAPLGFDNSLADTQGGVTLAANTTYWIPINLYAGPVAWALELGPAIVVTALDILDVGTNLTPSGSVGVGLGNLVRLPLAASSMANGQIILPRGGCALVARIGGTGGTLNFTCKAQQGP